MKSYDQIEQLVVNTMKENGYELNAFGKLSMTEELFETQSNGESITQQLDYIVNQAIPDGLRNDYFSKI